ncbi:hypothetical protein PPERSA_01081 [Pseudocohnilembus persalinus]|uniref:Generative cell specific-1/HAP2 domain-containing protein n=1 Tax=Pseudocohnilembus persalinus TaxID=266149 RepID=A0A0V0QUB2_PSEPJ|nr:hypothetical protein PPERSA_01081 [Pseudocohnilembus persalinus]|eukprot:KRX06003.1 hypothetical protein PPERSA_01081 [Pseudocohnilembus persalinus]
MLRLLIILQFLIFQINCEFISSSSVQKCETSSQSLLTDCQEKLVVTLTIENAQDEVTENYSTYLTSVSNQTSNQSSTSYITYPVKIELTKSQVYVIYELTYKQDFNNKPSEEVVTSSLMTCSDSATSSNPTCGFDFNSDGSKITDSQGYCCSCSFSDIIGVGDDVTRANICSFLNIGSGSAMAYCLNYDELWYSAYTIGSYYYYYEIDIDIKTIDPKTGKTISTETLQLGTESSVSHNEDNTILAKIIGDFTPINTPQTLSNYYLLKPTTPSSHHKVKAGKSGWMFIDKSLVTLDGSECNKIGVGYSAFKYESNKNPEYLISGFGNFQSGALSSGKTILYQTVKGTMATMITLEMNADNITWTTILGAGSIDYVKINDFEALSNNGIMKIQITNVGNLASEFNIVYNCSTYINSITTDSIYLASFETYIYEKKIQTSKEESETNSCTINLQDTNGNLLDRYDVDFNTTQVEYENKQGYSDDSEADVTYSSEPSSESEENCNDCSWYNIVCKAGLYCYWDVIKNDPKKENSGSKIYDEIHKYMKYFDKKAFSSKKRKSPTVKSDNFKHQYYLTSAGKDKVQKQQNLDDNQKKNLILQHIKYNEKKQRQTRISNFDIINNENNESQIKSQQNCNPDLTNINIDMDKNNKSKTINNKNEQFVNISSVILDDQNIQIKSIDSSQAQLFLQQNKQNRQHDELDISLYNRELYIIKEKVKKKQNQILNSQNSKQSKDQS